MDRQTGRVIGSPEYTDTTTAVETISKGDWDCSSVVTLMTSGDTVHASVTCYGLLVGWWLVVPTAQAIKTQQSQLRLHATLTLTGVSSGYLVRIYPHHLQKCEVELMVFVRFLSTLLVSIFHFWPAACVINFLPICLFFGFFLSLVTVGPVLATSWVTEGSSVNMVTWLLAPAPHSSYYYLEFHDLGQFI